MREKITLVLGGARSGKSAFAEKYILRKGSKVGYIATAEVLDEEMENRVKYHQARRNNGRWKTYEAPYKAEEAIAQAGEEVDAILFDCVTVYLANQIYGPNSPEDFDEKYSVAHAEFAKLLEAARKTGLPFVFVSNEVGAGVVPDTVMGREYRDIAGWINQQIGKEVDEVYYCIAGQAVDIKKLAFNLDDMEDRSGK